MEIVNVLILKQDHYILVYSVVHLENTLQFDLSDKLDIQSKSMTFIRQANSVLFQFYGCDPKTKMKLFKAYCLSLYTCALWRPNAHVLHALNVSFNNVIRRIWKFSYNCHTSIAHSVGLTTSIYLHHLFQIHQTAFYCSISSIQSHLFCIS